MVKDYIVNFVAPENRLKFKCYATKRKQARLMVDYFIAANNVHIGGDEMYLLTVDNRDHEPNVKPDHVLGQELWSKLNELE